MLNLLFNLIHWNNVGMRVNGKRLDRIRFANCVVLITDKLENINNISTTYNKASQNVVLKINVSKTKLMTNYVLFNF